jgi:hypothetical protein
MQIDARARSFADALPARTFFEAIQFLNDWLLIVCNKIVQIVTTAFPETFA